MEYKITIERITPPKEGEKYEDKTTIYEQRIENLDLWLDSVIKAVNKLV